MNVTPKEEHKVQIHVTFLEYMLDSIRGDTIIMHALYKRVETVADYCPELWVSRLLFNICEVCHIRYV